MFDVCSNSNQGLHEYQLALFCFQREQCCPHHGSVGWRSTPLTLSDLCENFLCKNNRVRYSRRYAEAVDKRAGLCCTPSRRASKAANRITC